MKITEEELLRLRLYGQHLTAKTDLETAAGDLCGFQSQYPANPRHMACLRAKDPEALEGLVKCWTLRGTLHLLPLSDLPLYLPQAQELAEVFDTPYGQWLYQRDQPVSRQRMAVFLPMIREGLEAGVRTREALRDLCRRQGMTPEEEALVFDGWGGAIRLLCEAGWAVCSPSQPRTYLPCPPLPPVARENGALELVRRYFTHYGPATLRDAAYFFRWPQKRLRDLLGRLDAQSFQWKNTEYFSLGPRPGRLPRVPDCLFLAGFDPMLLGYEKTENPILSPADLRRVFNLTGIVFPTVLLKGRVAGRWKEAPRAVLLQPFRSLTGGEREIVAARAAALFPEKPVRFQIAE